MGFLITCYVLESKLRIDFHAHKAGARAHIGMQLRDNIQKTTPAL